MERHEGPQTPFEVYCYNCRVTFAVGTRQCVHCGGALVGASHASRLAAAAATAAGTRQFPPEILDAANESAEPSLGRRVGGASLWVLIALGAALSRLCAGG